VQTIKFVSPKLSLWIACQKILSLLYTADFIVIEPSAAASIVFLQRFCKRAERLGRWTNIKALFEAAHGDRLEALYVVAVTTALRQGELLGLKWEDVDLEAETLSVRRSLSYTTKVSVFNNPKNGKGPSLKLTTATVDAVRRHKAAQNEERLQLGSLWEDYDLLFPTQTEQPMRAWSLTGGPFKRLLKRAGLSKKIRFHDLLHTCASLLLSQGVHPKFVQELLGHATISITLDTYSHVLPGMGDQTVVAMENALV
jgi:integrase